MSTKAIFAQCTDLVFQIAVYLKKNHHWNIQYILGYDFIEKDVKDEIPEAVFHPISRLKKGLGALNTEKFTEAPLDKKLVSSLFPYESMLMKMMNRLDYDGKLSYQKRILYYHRMVMYWKGVLDRLKPDVVYFQAPPHHNFDYILYALCRVQNVKTIMNQETLFPWVNYPIDNYEKGHPEILRTYNKKLITYNYGDQISVPENIENEIDRVQQKSFYDAIPIHTKGFLKLYGKKDESNFHYWMSFIYFLLKDIIKGVVLFYRKPNYIIEKYHRNLAPLKRRLLLNYYNRLVESVDLEKKFIFVALQCEPEATVAPTAGIFANQYLMVDIISKLIPQDWMVYVKEHPFQYRYGHKGERGRTKELYDHVSSLPNVKFVSLDITSYELIDSCIASASVTGSICWESVVRGKPTLLFGYNWFAGCEGVFQTHDVDELTEALQTITKGFEIDFNKVKIFINSIIEHSVEGELNGHYIPKGKLTKEENIRNLAEGIKEFYENMQV